MDIRRVLLLFSIQLVMVAIILNNFFMAQYSIYQPQYGHVVNIILGLLALLLNILGIFSIRNINRQIEENYRQKLMLERLRDMEEQLFIIRKYRHDFLNHLQVMSAYIEKGDIEKFKAYFSRIRSEIERTKVGFVTGNDEVDILFSSKINKALKNNIKVDASSFVNLPQEFLSAVDTVTIFGNLLDNAIEACAAVSDEEKRHLEIRVTEDPLDYVFEIANTYDEDQGLEKNKSSRKERGFGLFIVRETLKKYRGRISIEKNDRLFKATVEIPKKII
ncbi:MAG: GHKL domain-containing protein [Thermosediminibacteraceae bacterium]|nr:GHKL domain-containing protein [Thermosediminibacteraceae bacterium]